MTGKRGAQHARVKAHAESLTTPTLERLRGQLKSMGELLARGWTQGSGAKDAEGNLVTVFDARAASFCLLGAAHRAVGLHGACDLADLLGLINAAVPGTAWWNDAPGRTQEEVLALVDRLGGAVAAALAGREEGS